MPDPDPFPRLNRRAALKWISAAAASIPALQSLSFAAEKSASAIKSAKAQGYGPDPDRLKIYQPGDLWPLTFSSEQRELVIALCDIIMPADDHSPSASSVGVHDFLDEWISAPYPQQTKDRELILQGLDWLDGEAKRRQAESFVPLRPETQTDICQTLAIAAKRDRKRFPGNFFYLLRNLVAGGYYTTPAGMKDIGYIGNVARSQAPAPPIEVLDHLGLKPQ